MGPKTKWSKAQDKTSTGYLSFQGTPAKGIFHHLPLGWSQNSHFYNLLTHRASLEFWRLVGGWSGQLRQKKYTQKKKKPEARAEERKKSQTALTILLSTGTGRDEKGAPNQAPLVHSGPVKPMACSRRLKNICHVILNLKGLQYEFQNVLERISRVSLKTYSRRLDFLRIFSRYFILGTYFMMQNWTGLVLNAEAPKRGTCSLTPTKGQVLPFLAPSLGTGWVPGPWAARLKGTRLVWYVMREGT